MANKERFIHFRHADGSAAFVIVDGGTIFIDGKEKSLTYIDEGFFLADLKCYSHDEFMREVVLTGHRVTVGKGLVGGAMVAKA